MPIRSVTLRILGESKDALAKMKAVNAEADKLEKRKVNVKIGVDLDQKDVTALRAKVTALGKLTATINVKLDMPNILADFAKIKTELQALRVLANKLDITPHTDIAELARANAMLTAMNLAALKAAGGVTKVATDTAAADRKIGTIFQSGRGFGAWTRFFGGKFLLFGGVAAIGGLHLLADAILEVLAVWIPATVAAVAFGIAASDAARSVFTHMQNLHTVMDATNRVIPPMTGNMEKLHEAVRPAVYQVFGDALTIMNEKTGLFQTLALGTASVVEHLAARMTVAITAGHGMSEFMKNAVPDVAKLGDAFASLFGIIGNILHVMPGYAVILLNFGGGLLHILEVATKVAQPFIGIGLAVHGFIVWAGLGATLALALGKAIIFLGDTAIGKAIAGLATWTADLIVTIATEGIATGATEVFAAALALLSANPLIWIGVAIGALIGLVFWMNQSKKTTLAWASTLQQSVDSAASVAQGLVLAQQAVSISGVRLAVQQDKLAHTQEYATTVASKYGTAVKGVSWEYKNQQAITEQTRAAYEKFNAQVQFNQGRMQGLTKVYGNQHQVMGLLAAAGVTQKEWQDKSAEGWLILTQKINATIAGYKAMGQTGGTLNNDLAVMDRSVADQYTAMQKLNQAWSQFTSDLTGSQNAFDTTALGLHTLAQNFSKANAATSTTTHHLGEIKTSSSLAHAAIDGLNQASLALNQAFTQQVTNTSSLIATWRTAGIASNLFTTGVKDSIAPLVKYARGSQEATAQLIGLAEQAGYSGPLSLSKLVKWLGNTHDALGKVKSITNQATTQEALLTGALQAQGSYIANTLIRDIQQAEFAYFGVTGKARAYGDAVARYGDQSVVARQKAKLLTDSIIESGLRAHQTTGQMASLIAKILGIPLKRAIQIVETGVGNFSITGAPGHELPHHRPTGHAAGWLVPGSGNADIVPALLTPGEAVVPKYLTPMVAPLLKAHGVPGFASGGVVRTGNIGALTGDAAVKFDQDFIAQFTSSMEGAMTTAMKSAIQQAFAAMVGNVGAGVARWRGLVLKALGMEGLSSMLAGRVLFQMQTESGGNPNAINLTDSNAAAGDPSRGLLQTIMSTFRAYHWPGTSWNIYDPLANIAAAINYARHRYGPLLMSGGMGMGSGHGYGLGTMGAQPGWAWTGEFGPELVRFHGGEPVLSHSSSLANAHLAGGGYGSGTGFAPFSSSRAAVHAGSGDVYYITVNGDTDPDGAALRIQQKLSKFKRRHGNVNLGFN